MKRRGTVPPQENADQNQNHETHRHAHAGGRVAKTVGFVNQGAERLDPPAPLLKIQDEVASVESPCRSLRKLNTTYFHTIDSRFPYFVLPPAGLLSALSLRTCFFWAFVRADHRRGASRLTALTWPNVLKVHPCRGEHEDGVAVDAAQRTLG